MDLKNLTPKDKMLYETMLESKGKLIDKLNQEIVPEDFEETLYLMSRAEYKRGKADGFALKDGGVAE